jgi:nitrous-oxide reductase
MKLLLDFPTFGEPHYAQAVPASLTAASATAEDSKSATFYP